MMTKRQYEILEHLLHHEDEFYSSKTLADLFGISVRTIKTDIKAIKQFSAKQNTFELQTLPSKGTRVVTENSEQAYTAIESSKKQMDQAIKKQQGDRTLTLIQLLLDSTGYVSKYTLFEKLYISESTLYKSIHEVREKLKKYRYTDNLVIWHK